MATAQADVVFDAGIDAVRSLATLATVASDVDGWIYRHDRDLTGFIDGTEIPSQLAAYERSWCALTALAPAAASCSSSSGDLIPVRL